MAERANMYRPIDDHFALRPTGVLLGKLLGSAAFRNMGDYENATFTIDKQEESIWSPQTPERSKIATIFNEVEVKLQFSLQQMNDLTRAAVHQSEPKMLFEQTAQNDKPFAFAGVGPGDILPLGFRQITKISLGNAYVENVHYQIDAAAGHLEIIEHPSKGETGDIAGTFSAAAIAGRKVWGVASRLDLRGAFMFRSTNLRKNGPRQLSEWWDVGIVGDGETALGANSSDPGKVALVGNVYADPTKELAFQYGRVTDLPPA